MSPSTSGRRRLSPLILHDDLFTQVLLLLPVKSLMQLKCVCKSWNTLISGPTFVELHLQQSQRRKRQLLLTYVLSYDDNRWFVPLSICRLLSNTSITLDCRRLMYTDCSEVVGSCNGLICLLGRSANKHRAIWFRVWNPATGNISEKLGSLNKPRKRGSSMLRYTFGYDISTGSYKVVGFDTREVKVFGLTDNVWRNLPCVPDNAGIVCWDNNVNKGEYLSGTINWLAIQNWLQCDKYCENISIMRFVIISLDLGMETYKKMMPPPDCDQVPFVIEPIIAVLMDCLCFAHHLRTHFVIWKMTQFGVEKSWSRFLKISYQDLQIDIRFNEKMIYHPLLLSPLCLSENGDKLILANNHEDQAIIYNIRDNRVELTRIINSIQWFLSKNYVESLVPIC
ncbi:putative F-box domain-containing protein [Medicago truncatula]|uniref:Putative F-box domain-containing protein n=1 Tax=Medicago truncatula TaxID=3880 RepID=A0A396HUW8_MEDTR|nr:F-box/kelch-repeat protein At3g23880-like [Medicago truncatula]RHN56341.1 putative F-box domain-containing protein [Medicago truncatula]